MSLNDILDIINLVGIFGAIVVSIITLFSSKRLQKMQQQVSIMTENRSKRIDDMRIFSASIISLAHLLNSGKSVDPKNDTSNLVKNVCHLVSQLQYIYDHDIELIDCAKWIENALVFSENPPNSQVISIMIEKLWIYTDLYIGTEHERLKLEVGGEFQKTGETEKEATSFEDIYQKLKEQLPDEKRKILEYIP